MYLSDMYIHHYNGVGLPHNFRITIAYHSRNIPASPSVTEKSVPHVKKHCCPCGGFKGLSASLLSLWFSVWGLIGAT